MRKIKEVFVLHHNHIDIGYTHPQTAFWNLSDRFIDEAIDLCEATADFPEAARMRWTCEVTAPVMHWLEQASEQQIKRLKKLVKNRQIAFGAMFCNISALYNTEELIQSFYPVRRIQEVLGAKVSVAINHDVNGLSWSLIGLLKEMDIEYLLMGINVHMGGFPLERPRGFNWEGPDGQKVLVYSGEHYNMFNRVMKLAETDDLQVMEEGLKAYISKLEKKDYPYDFVYLSATHPAFNDNNPPDGRLPEIIKKWNASGRELKIRMITPDMLFERLKNQPAETLPTHRGDWVDYWTFGCASSALEVAANRQARSIFGAAQALDATMSYFGKRDQQLQDAFWNIAVADEHTWGAFCSTGNFCPSNTIEPFPVAEQWYLKAAYMYQGRSLSQMILRDLLEIKAGNSVQGKGLNGVMLFNPNPVAKKEVVKIPLEVMEQEWFHLSSKIHQINTYQSFLNEETAFFMEPVELGPFELKVIPSVEIRRASIPDDVVAREGCLENRFYKLSYDRATGHITSIQDKEGGRELIDSYQDLNCFEPILEKLHEPTPVAIEKKDMRESFCELDYDRWHAGEDCWNPGWKACYERPELLEVRVLSTPEGAVLNRRWKGPGEEEMEQTITLVETQKKIRFEAYFNKKDNTWPEALFFAFPLAVKDGKVHYDSGVIPTEYGKECLKGGCLDWFTTNSWVASHNDQGTIVLAAPDAPLFQVGGFNFARRLKEGHPKASELLLAWPMNNYWNTNFRASQPGFIRLRYEMTSFIEFSAAKCIHFAQSVMLPLDWHPVIGETDAGNQELIQIEDEEQTVQLVQLKKSVDRKGIIVRLVNHGNQQKEVCLKLPRLRIIKAYACKLNEEPGQELKIKENSLNLSLNPLQVQSYYILIAGQFDE
jgi:hypothetical protein